MSKISPKRKGGGDARRPSQAQKVKHQPRDTNATARKPSRRKVSRSQARAPGARAVPAEQLGTSSGPFARVCLGLVFRLDVSQLHITGAVSAADLAAIKQRVVLAEGPFGKARTDVAKVFQARPTALPIVWLLPPIGD